MAASPRCPYCNAQGLNQLTAKPAGLFLVVYCKSCGAIHGIIPKPTEQQPVVATAEPAVTPPTLPPDPQPEPNDLDLRLIPKTPPKENKPVEQQTKKVQRVARQADKLTPDRARAMAKAHLHKGSTMYRIIRDDGEE